MAGNHSIANFISGLQRPSFQTYIAQLEVYTTKTWKICTGSEKALHIACEEGYDALVIRLLSKERSLRNLKGLLLLERSLIAAINCRQKSVVRVLLTHLPTGLKSFVSDLQSFQLLRRSNSYKKANVLDTALGYAAMKNWLWAVLLFLKHGARASSQNILQGLNKASSRGYEDVVRVLSKRIQGQKRRNLLGALTSAVENGHEGIVKIILGDGMKIPQDSFGPGLIHLAAKKGHKGILRLLLSKAPGDYYVYPNIDTSKDPYVYSASKDGSRYTYGGPKIKYENWCCLHFAIYHKHYGIVKFLLETDSMPRDHVEHRTTAMPLASQRGCTDIVKLLLANGFDASATMQGHSALELATRYGHTNIMTLLLDAGERVTLYHLLNAASSGSLPAVSLLLDRGADVQASSTSRQTPLHVAVAHHHLEVVRFLLKAGAKTEAFNCNGDTPLHLAIEGNQVEFVRLLLKYGADTESQSGVKTKYGSIETKRALFCAINSRNPHLIPELLRYGAKLESGGVGGTRPFHGAARNGSVVALETLLAAGAQIHATDAQQRTALHYAVRGDNIDAISTLLSWGLDVNARDSSGQIPLHLATYKVVSPAYDLLVSHGADVEAKDNKGMSVADCQYSSQLAWHGA
ncbi:ankyrin repeat-containing domain protein [Talaromyces proteolyticus]|uniref:Ankyrin repeat-containing domain protein n=1 Tax=Talaromyces proteolyticus TaxID=1131652 RepID=A0AAD4L428_9EURO|nr:ankyrin repeat-containing domain protein [Talaromyces proteolyticus]KAH8703182.1 ankyrin repeat-containing domain protein [Talaromyces proteolyticus]